MDYGVIEFGGLATLYGFVTSFTILGCLWLCGRREYLRFWPLLFTTLTFVFLTQHPFPSPSALICPVDSASPQLVPFRFLRSFWRLHYQEAELSVYFTNRVIAASVMNFVLCLAIGLALSRHVKTLRVAAIYGGCLTLAVELTQLTGTWGIYSCAYRQFNVDDLILNAAGVICGVSIGAFWHIAAIIPPQSRR
jgi:glycopeptide antibiotics resistance protein